MNSIVFSAPKGCQISPISCCTCDGLALLLSTPQNIDRIVIVKQDKVVKSWEEVNNHYLSSLILLSDGNLVSGSLDGSLKKRDLVADPPEVMWMRNLEVGIDALAELSDGRMVAGCRDGTVHVLDNTGQTSFIGKNHSDLVHTVGSLGDQIYTASFNKVCLWTFTESELQSTVIQPMICNELVKLLPSPCGKWMAASFAFGWVVLFRICHDQWDIKWDFLIGSSRWPRSLSFSSDGRFLFVDEFVLEARTGIVLKMWNKRCSPSDRFFVSPNATAMFVVKEHEVWKWEFFATLKKQLASLSYGRAGSTYFLFVRLRYRDGTF